MITTASIDKIPCTRLLALRFTCVTYTPYNTPRERYDYHLHVTDEEANVTQTGNSFSHTVRQRQSQDWNPAPSDSKVYPLSTTLSFYTSSSPATVWKYHLLLAGVYFKCNASLVLKFFKNLEKFKKKTHTTFSLREYHFYHFDVYPSSFFPIYTPPHTYSKYYVFKCYVFYLLIYYLLRYRLSFECHFCPAFSPFTWAFSHAVKFFRNKILNGCFELIPLHGYSIIFKLFYYWIFTFV